MDRLEGLANSLSQVTMYDIKSMYNQVCVTCASPLTRVKGSGVLLENKLLIDIQAKNMVMNVSEMEAKVQEATNDEPWCVRSIRQFGMA
jgi:epsin